MIAAEHDFAHFIRILGKGRNGARSLDRSEARDSMTMICRCEVEPEQLGAFLMLLRVKEETAEEIAGFIDALRASLPIVSHLPQAAIDWPAYAGKKRQLPWFVLAALIAHATAVIGTLALVIRALGLESRHDDAHGLAAEWWRDRQLQLVQEQTAGVS